MKLAAYFDRFGDDDVSVAEALGRCGVRNVILRTIDRRNISVCGDDRCQQLLKLAKKYQFSYRAMFSDIGDKSLVVERPVVLRLISLAQYFGLTAIRVTPGTTNTSTAELYEFMHTAVAEFQRSSVTVLVEPGASNALRDADSIIRFYREFPSVRYVYDPVGFLAKQAIPPLTYWKIIADRVFAVDMSDAKVGGHLVPFGTGAARWTELFEDNNDFEGYALLNANICPAQRDLVGKAAIATADCRQIRLFLDSLQPNTKLVKPWLT